MFFVRNFVKPLKPVYKMFAHENNNLCLKNVVSNRFYYNILTPKCISTVKTIPTSVKENLEQNHTASNRRINSENTPCVEVRFGSNHLIKTDLFVSFCWIIQN